MTELELEDLIKERDYLEAMCDKLAACIAPNEVLGEHSSMNDPWANALEYAARANTLGDSDNGPLQAGTENVPAIERHEDKAATAALQAVIDAHFPGQIPESWKPTEVRCTCKDAFGQLIWSEACEMHDRCQAGMPGVPIRCILTKWHKGDHK